MSRVESRWMSDSMDRFIGVSQPGACLSVTLLKELKYWKIYESNRCIANNRRDCGGSKESWAVEMWIMYRQRIYEQCSTERVPQHWEDAISVIGCRPRASPASPASPTRASWDHTSNILNVEFSEIAVSWGEFGIKMSSRFDGYFYRLIERARCVFLRLNFVDVFDLSPFYLRIFTRTVLPSILLHSYIVSNIYRCISTLPTLKLTLRQYLVFRKYPSCRAERLIESNLNFPRRPWIGVPQSQR